MRRLSGRSILFGVQLTALAATGLLACGGEGAEGPEMRPGEPCLQCHRAGGKASEEAFTAAGTIFSSGSGGAGLAGATITITGSDNHTVTLTSNAAGNFYTRAAIALPGTVMVSTASGDATMSSPLTSGNCNACHTAGGSAGIHIHP